MVDAGRSRQSCRLERTGSGQVAPRFSADYYVAFRSPFSRHASFISKPALF